MANAPPSSKRAAGGAESARPGSPGRAARTSKVILDDVAIRRCLVRIAHEIIERSEDALLLYLVGIPRGGVPLARLVAKNLGEVAGTSPPVGILDTTLYRDDRFSGGARPRLRLTEMPSVVDERQVVLVDDVVSTGRTVRAAMDALMDFGRPRCVQVAALVDRGHRELPIKIDYVGKNIPTERSDLVELRADDDAPEGSMEMVLLRGPGANPAPGADPDPGAATGEPS